MRALPGPQDALNGVPLWLPTVFVALSAMALDAKAASASPMARTASRELDMPRICMILPPTLSPNLGKIAMVHSSETGGDRAIPPEPWGNRIHRLVERAGKIPIIFGITKGRATWELLSPPP